MAKQRFRLSARVSSDRPDAVRTTLERHAVGGSLRFEEGEFVLEVGATGPSAKELNRSLLSELRRAEKRTRLRAEWRAPDGTTYRFFDYVLKKTFRT